MPVDDPVHRRRWATLAILCVSLLVIVIDNTIVNVALPTLVRDLGTSISDLQWVVDAYTLVFAGLLLTAGSLGDRFGRKGALTVGLVVFGGASAAAAFAGGVDSLIAARAVMGIGAALIMPATLSILTNVFTDTRERALAIGLWSGVAGIAVALGPVTGGFLLEHFWWGSVFIVNVPIVIAAIVAGHFLVPTSRNPQRPKLDLVGAGLSIVGLGALVAAIIEAPSNGWTSPLILAGFVIAVALGGRVRVVGASRRRAHARRALLRQPPLHRRQRERDARCSSRCSASSSWPRSTCSSCSATPRSRPGCARCRSRSR